jgi:hypothetical protein
MIHDMTSSVTVVCPSLFLGCSAVRSEAADELSVVPRETNAKLRVQFFWPFRGASSRRVTIPAASKSPNLCPFPNQRVCPLQAEKA